MKRNTYIEPKVIIKPIYRQCILAGSYEEIPSSSSSADEWGAKQAAGLWDSDGEEE